MNIFSLTMGDNIELRGGVKFVLNDVAYRKILAKWNDDGSYRGKMVPSPMDIVKVSSHSGVEFMNDGTKNAAV